MLKEAHRFHRFPFAHLPVIVPQERKRKLVHVLWVASFLYTISSCPTCWCRIYTHFLPASTCPIVPNKSPPFLRNLSFGDFTSQHMRLRQNSRYHNAYLSCSLNKQILVSYKVNSLQNSLKQNVPWLFWLCVTLWETSFF